VRTPAPRRQRLIFFQVPELRGFEVFCQGRPVEEMPRITTRICGVCPEAHHMASVKAADAVHGVTAAWPDCAAPVISEVRHEQGWARLLVDVHSGSCSPLTGA
jgi:hypothetical protein